MKRAPVVATVLSTWFGCGYSPVAPGTVGSLGALSVVPLWLAFGWHPIAFLALTLVALPASIWAAGQTAIAIGRKDPQIVVVDEVLGTWLALAGATHLNWISIVAAFALFRLFDIWKPGPIRQLEAMPGGHGIVADDLMAGLFAAIILFLAGRTGLY